jgi:hypothetical protein
MSLRSRIRSLPWLVRFRRQVGRRGFFMLTLGWVDIVYGYQLWSPPNPTEPRWQYVSETVPFADVHAALEVWAVIWWLVAVACIVSAFRKDDRWGYGAAAGVKVAWTVTWVIAACRGLDEGWRTASVWFMVMIAVLVISTWPEDCIQIQAISDRLDAEENERDPHARHPHHADAGEGG